MEDPGSNPGTVERILLSPSREKDFEFLKIKYNCFPGLNSSLLDGKVINGFPVVQQDVKFMASLKMNSIHFCGGCVISTKHILTAGQCIYLIKLQGVMDFANIIVWLGTIHLFGYGITRNVKDLEHHPQFDPLAPRETCAFDIGVILVCLINREKQLIVLLGIKIIFSV